MLNTHHGESVDIIFIYHWPLAFQAICAITVPDLKKIVFMLFDQND